MTAADGTAVATADRPLAGIALYNLSFVFLVAMDIVIKLLAADYPLGQLVMARCVFGLLPILLVVLVSGRGTAALRPRRPGRLVLRGLVHAGALGSFFYALGRLPLADAYALAFTAPLFVTALSMPILREPVGVRRWAAVAIGFVGILVMLRPGSAGIALPADGIAAAIFGAFCFALMSVMTRKLARDETNEAIVLVSTLTVGGLAALTLPFGFVAPVDAVDALALAAVGLLGGTGFLLMTQAFRQAPVAVLAPFEYTTMIYAVVFGFLIWGDVPDAPLFAGAAIVIGCGLYILHRERTLARQRRRALATPPAPRG